MVKVGGRRAVSWAVDSTSHRLRVYSVRPVSSSQACDQYIPRPKARRADGISKTYVAIFKSHRRVYFDSSVDISTSNTPIDVTVRVHERKTSKRKGGGGKRKKKQQQ